MKRPPIIAVMAGLLAVLTFVTFAPAFKADFVDYDDSDYVTANSHVQAGLSWDSVKWAFTASHASNWHPLTWLSHMLDWQLYGANPWGHHLTSVILHSANATILFLVLVRLIGGRWRSLVVAALFALHPLRVESVAWISERKDVLSALFALLTLWAYALYVWKSEIGSQKPGTSLPDFNLRPLTSGFYWLALLFFTLGLMSKPMVVTLPFVLLLLDYWPLRRLTRLTLNARPAPMVRLVCEKLPFLALSAACSVITLQVQQLGGAFTTLTRLSLGARVENALVAYARYLHKTIWPVDLAILYPHPGHWPTVQVLGAAILVLGISAGVILSRHRWPAGFVGWFWFIGMLMPVIGLVQVGAQAMADRYTYLPLIGLFLLVTWSVPDWRSRYPWQTILVTTGVIIVLAACVIATRAQLRYWQNRVALFERALAVTPPNVVALYELGAALEKANRNEEAILRYRQALQLAPEHAVANYNLGNALSKERQYAEAVNHYERAIQSSPKATEMHNNLANALAEIGQLDEAVRHYQIALEGKPGDAVAHNNLANVLMKLGRSNDAIAHYEAALRERPNYAEACNNLGTALVSLGRTAEALRHFHKALSSQPENTGFQQNLTRALRRLDDSPGEAARYFAEAVRLSPQDGQAHYGLALAKLDAGEEDEALAHLQQALALEPSLLTQLNNRAWGLATQFDVSGRNGKKAVVLARAALKDSGSRRAEVLDTLAAAYAEVGDFAAATNYAKLALSLARVAEDTALAEQISQRLTLYQQGQPYREPPRTP